MSLWDVVGIVVTLLVLAHMLVGYIRFVLIVMFADGGGLPDNKWRIFFTQVFFWLWEEIRQRRRMEQHTGLK